MPNSNSAGNTNLMRIINSDIFKTFITLTLFVASTIGYLYTIKSEIDKSFLNLNHKIELQNLQIENRLKNVEDTQDRNFKYITDNYIKKTDIMQFKK